MTEPVACTDGRCPDYAEAKISWMTSAGLQMTGALCGMHLASYWDKLSRFPDAVASATIWPADTADHHQDVRGGNG